MRIQTAKKLKHQLSTVRVSYTLKILLAHIIMELQRQPPPKRQKREDYRKAQKAEAQSELPKKKFYRQRAHANPFSDHQLT